MAAGRDRKGRRLTRAQASQRIQQLKEEAYRLYINESARQSVTALEKQMTRYEQGRVSHGIFQAQMGMTYSEALHRWYLYQIALSRGIVRSLKARGLLTAEACREILGGEVLRL